MREVADFLFDMTLLKCYTVIIKLFYRSETI